MLVSCEDHATVLYQELLMDRLEAMSQASLQSQDCLQTPHMQRFAGVSPSAAGGIRCCCAFGRSREPFSELPVMDMGTCSVTPAVLPAGLRLPGKPQQPLRLSIWLPIGCLEGLKGLLVDKCSKQPCHQSCNDLTAVLGKIKCYKNKCTCNMHGSTSNGSVSSGSSNMLSISLSTPSEALRSAIQAQPLTMLFWQTACCYAPLLICHSSHLSHHVSAQPRS